MKKIETEKSMKILWIEISVPGQYSENKSPIRGWQDALQVEVTKQCPNLELGIVFLSSNIKDQDKNIKGVKYFPIHYLLNPIEKLKNKWTWEIEMNKVLPKIAKIANNFQPDIIQIFGSEFYFPLLANYVNYPIVIHLQASIPPYTNAEMPPGYSRHDVLKLLGINIKKQIGHRWAYKKIDSQIKIEEKSLRQTKYFMGRTLWDKMLIRHYNKSAKYYYCSEMLRPDFYTAEPWHIHTNRNKIKLVTIGCTSFVKGMDTVLRTARKLQDQNVEFEWNVVGKMDRKEVFEYKEKLSFSECNIILHGYLNTKELISLLQDSDVMIHPAYIDNSPNAICEAQYLGLPVIATYVGGIPSLINTSVDGLLLPANDPLILCQTIIELCNNKNMQTKISKNARNKAIIRHDPTTIIKDLTNCYNNILYLSRNE